MDTSKPTPDHEGIRQVLARATGTGWEAAYRQDVGALLGEVDGLRAEVAASREALTASQRAFVSGLELHQRHADGALSTALRRAEAAEVARDAARAEAVRDVLGIIAAEAKGWREESGTPVVALGLTTAARKIAALTPTPTAKE